MARPKIHKHRVQSSREQDWTYCITPSQCAAIPGRQSAHGNIHVIDTCACGAVRHSEINGRKNRGPWIEVES